MTSPGALIITRLIGWGIACGMKITYSAASFSQWGFKMKTERQYYLVMVAHNGRLQSVQGPFQPAIAHFLKMPYQVVVTGKQLQQLQEGNKV